MKFYFYRSLERNLASAENISFLPHVRFTVTLSPGRLFQPLRNILFPRWSGQKSSHDLSYLPQFVSDHRPSPATPPIFPAQRFRHAKPLHCAACNFTYFSQSLSKCTHSAANDGRVTAVLRHDDTQSHDKSDTRCVPLHLKL